MYRVCFHWGATAEKMEIVRRRKKSPETLRLVERRLKKSRPGKMRRKFDMYVQLQVWVPSGPKNRGNPDRDRGNRWRIV